MARLARSTIDGLAHLVVQRSHHGQPVFDDCEDYVRYLDWLRQYALRYGLNIWAFCLRTMSMLSVSPMLNRPWPGYSTAST